MSSLIYDGRDGVTITQYAGPASLGADRRCYQITTPDGRYVQLTAAQFDALVRAVVRVGVSFDP